MHETLARIEHRIEETRPAPPPKPWNPDPHDRAIDDTRKFCQAK